MTYSSARRVSLPGPMSLPVGGESTHCVLSGHRGLPAAKLFTNLDRLQEGDTFMLNVLNDTLTYEVDQIRIVLPDELYDLEIEPGQDYCTLVTCTPYGINTHRLLVRGHRVGPTVRRQSVKRRPARRTDAHSACHSSSYPPDPPHHPAFQNTQKAGEKGEGFGTDHEKLRELIDSRIAEEDASLNDDANGPNSEPAETPPEPPQSSENDNIE